VPSSDRSAPSSLSGPLAWVVAWRFLRGHRSRLLDGTARAALLATALGVTAMMIAMALMTGYREDLQSKLVRGNAAVIAYPVGTASQALTPARRAALLKIPGVRKVGRVAYGQGSLGSPERPQGLEVVLRGIDPGDLSEGQLAATAEQIGTGKDGIPGAVLGADLSARLGAKTGDVLRLVALGFSAGRPRFRYQSLRITGTFATGFAEFDRSWVLLDRPVVERLMGGMAGDNTGSDLVELTVADPAEAPRIAEAATAVLEPDFIVTDWRQLNRELFTALKLQQIALFLVLGLIVLVSTFNVASTLVVLVRERMRDIGLLGALGLPPGSLRRIFLLYGGFLGGLGTLLGVTFGWAVCWVLTTFELIRFDSEVAAIYFIRSVPFRVEISDVLAIVGFAFLVTLLACLVPAWRAARIEPSSALRYE
jgi:lipoprotein-releasing system permease protein